MTLLPRDSSTFGGDIEHADRLSLLPLEDKPTPNEPAHRPESHGSDS